MGIQYEARKAIYGAEEASYGASVTLGADDAIETTGVSISPANVNGQDKAFDRNYFGAYRNVPVNQSEDVSFVIYLAGSGVADEAPRYGRYLEACALAQSTLNPSQVLRATAAAPASGAGVEGEVRIVEGTGRVLFKYLSRWMEIEDRTFANSSTGAWSTSAVNPTAAIPASPSSNDRHINNVSYRVFRYTGTAWVAEDDLSDLVMGRNEQFKPISDSVPSVSLRAEYQNVLHPIAGARGTFGFDVNSGGLPQINFDFRGLYSDSERKVPANAITPAYGGIAGVVGVNKGNTKAWIFGREVVLSAFSFNLGNTSEYINDPGFEAVEVVGRQSSGSLTVQLDDGLAPNFTKLAKESAEGFLRIRHGSAANNVVELIVPVLQIMNPTYGESQGRHMVQMDFRPLQAGSGNDDFGVLFR